MQHLNPTQPPTPRSSRSACQAVAMVTLVSVYHHGMGIIHNRHELFFAMTPPQPLCVKELRWKTRTHIRETQVRSHTCCIYTPTYLPPLPPFYLSASLSPCQSLSLSRPFFLSPRHLSTAIPCTFQQNFYKKKCVYIYTNPD